jgi:hypothetical protein
MSFSRANYTSAQMKSAALDRRPEQRGIQGSERHDSPAFRSGSLMHPWGKEHFSVGVVGTIGVRTLLLVV